MTYSGKDLLSSSCCWDGAQSLSLTHVAFFVSGSQCQDTGVLKLNAVSQVYAVLGRGQYA